mgnify:CR=1 FL=1
MEYSCIDVVVDPDWWACFAVEVGFVLHSTRKSCLGQMLWDELGAPEEKSVQRL